MKKRILSLAAVLVYAAVSVFGSSNVFAESNYTQRVALKTYQPAVGNLVYDDDFNDVLVTGAMHEFDSNSPDCRTTQSDYNVSTITKADGCKVDDASDNTAVSLEKSTVVYLPKTIKSNKLVVSFDIYATEAKSLSYRLVNKGKLDNMAFYFNTWSSGMELSFSTNSKFKSSYSSAEVAKLLNHWVNNTLVFERVLNSDGTGYDVYLRELYLDGVKYDTSALTAATDIDWWTVVPNTNNFYIEAMNNSTYLDNVLVYAPAVNEEEIHQVAVPSYLPKVGTLVLDDTFESSYTSGTKVNSSYTYGIKEFDAGTTTSGIEYGLMNSGNSKYGAFNAWTYAYPNVTGSVVSDKFVVSFDFKCPADVHQKGFNICFGGKTLALRLYFENDADSKKWKLTLIRSGTASEKFADSFTISKDEFTNIGVVFQKVKDTNGADKAILSEAYVNGKKLDLISGTDTKYLATNWFSTSSGSYPVAIGNFGVAGFALDNVIAYAPLKFEAKNAEISSDGSSAEITFSDTIGNIDGATVNAKDALGNTVSSQLSADGNKLTATFPQLVNVNDKVYTLIVSGVKNTRGDIAPDYTKVYGTGVAGFDLEKQEVYISNNLNVPINGDLIIAAYDGNQLLGISTAPVNNVAVDTVATISNGSIPVTTTTPTLYKLLIWDSFDNAMPYCHSLEYPMQVN